MTEKDVYRPSCIRNYQEITISVFRAHQIIQDVEDVGAGGAVSQWLAVVRQSKPPACLGASPVTLMHRAHVGHAPYIQTKPSHDTRNL